MLLQGSAAQRGEASSEGGASGRTKPRYGSAGEAAPSQPRLLSPSRVQEAGRSTPPQFPRLLGQGTSHATPPKLLSPQQLAALPPHPQPRADDRPSARLRLMRHDAFGGAHPGSAPSASAVAAPQPASIPVAASPASAALAAPLLGAPWLTLPAGAASLGAASGAAGSSVPPFLASLLAQPATAPTMEQLQYFYAYHMQLVAAQQQLLALAAQHGAPAAPATLPPAAVAGMPLPAAAPAAPVAAAAPLSPTRYPRLGTFQRPTVRQPTVGDALAAAQVRVATIHGEASIAQ